MLRLIQLTHPHEGRRIALVEEPKLHLLAHYRSIYHLAEEAIDSKHHIADMIPRLLSRELLDYDEIYQGRSEWKILPAFDHPGEAARCFVTGTGLTHRASADLRQSMHNVTGPISDSMKMYQIGIEGGRPEAGTIGAAPEWFYKGTGAILRAHNQPLEVPGHGEDGGEEAEIAGVYLIGPNGTPYRVGLVQGNEFSDHVLEAQNYLYLASSKLRTCAIGPELIVDADFSDLHGKIAVERNGRVLWDALLSSGEKWMCHSLANLEHHHFKHSMHREEGDAHIHFLGADMFSFKDKLRLEEGDVMTITYEGFGRPLRNPLHMEERAAELVSVEAL